MVRFKISLRGSRSTLQRVCRQLRFRSIAPVGRPRITWKVFLAAYTIHPVDPRQILVTYIGS